MFQANPPDLGYSDSAGTVLMNSIQQRLRTVPGVENVAIANTTILTGSGFRRTFTIGDQRIVTERTVPGLRVSPGFFATVGARVVAGREFNQTDTRDFADGYRSVVVNQSFARRYFGNRNPVGQRVGVGGQPDTPTNIEIVGVIEDFSFRFIREDEPEHVFFPFIQQPSRASDGTFYLRVRGDPEATFGAIRAAVAQIDPVLPVRNLTTLDDQVDRSLATARALATLSSGFGAIALLLSVIGLYGVMSFVVTERRRAIGVRVALGATRSNALWLITSDALVMIVAGIALALPASWALRRLVEAELFGVRAFDGSTIALASGLLALVAIGAALRPAWSAATIDPSEALRFE
jgi:predicted permease